MKTSVETTTVTPIVLTVSHFHTKLQLNMINFDVIINNSELFPFYDSRF